MKSSTSENKNVYDANGTVLFRVLSREDHEQKMAASTALDPSTSDPTAAADGSDLTLVGGGISMAAKYGPMGSSKIRTLGAKKPRKLMALSPTLFSLKEERPTAVAHHLTVEKALSQLFPPTPLQPVEGSGAAQTSNAKTSGRSSSAPAKTSKQKWLKVAATDHTSRLDVVQLHQHLQNRCTQEHARIRGVLCPIREKIFNDGLDELTRQITVLCPERGVLLKDLNAAMAQTTETYDILFDSACQYAVRKSIERDLNSFLFEEKKQLESEVRRLENRVNELRAKHDGMMKRFEEQKTVNAKLHEEEINYLKKANQQFISEIKRLVTMESQK